MGKKADTPSKLFQANLDAYFLVNKYLLYFGIYVVLQEHYCNLYCVCSKPMEHVRLCKVKRKGKSFSMNVFTNQMIFI